MVDARINSTPPESLLKALASVRLDYTDSVELYHCIRCDINDAYCGVFGDGENWAMIELPNPISCILEM